MGCPKVVESPSLEAPRATWTWCWAPALGGPKGAELEQRDPEVPASPSPSENILKAVSILQPNWVSYSFMYLLHPNTPKFIGAAVTE